MPDPTPLPGENHKNYQQGFAKRAADPRPPVQPPLPPRPT